MTRVTGKFRFKKKKTLTPIARWDVVPYQRIEQDTTLNIGVVAFSKPGINYIKFTFTDGTNTHSYISRAMTLNSDSGVWEYWATLRAEDYIAGTVTCRATVWGVDGGYRVLEDLPLRVDSDGSLAQPEAWVATDGNNATAQVNNSALPYKSITHAIVGLQVWNAANGNGTTPQGGIVRLKAGTHEHQSGVTTAVNCSDEWVTVTVAEGGTKENTILQNGVDNYWLYPFGNVKLCLRGFSINYTVAGNGTIASRSAADGFVTALWCDDMTLTGAGRYVVGSGNNPTGNPINNQWGTIYYTNCDISECKLACVHSWNIAIARDVAAHDIGCDVFATARMVVNCNAYDIGPLKFPKIEDIQWIPTGDVSGYSYVLRKTNAFADFEKTYNDAFRFESYMLTEPVIAAKISDDAIRLSSGGPVAGTYNGWLKTDWHSDVWQWYYSSSNALGKDQNLIVYGLRGVTDGQGFSNNWGSEDNPANGAFVNMYFKSAQSSYWARRADHLVWQHCTFEASDHVNQQWAFYFGDESEQYGSALIENMQMHGCCFEGTLLSTIGTHAWSAGETLDDSDCDQNHYRNYDYGSLDVTPGTNYTTGDPKLDANGVPEADSDCVGRLSPLVPQDLAGNVRSDPTDIGAYEYQAP